MVSRITTRRTAIATVASSLAILALEGIGSLSSAQAPVTVVILD